MVGKHSVFGRVCNGIAVVNRMGMVEVDKNDRLVLLSFIVICYPIFIQTDRQNFDTQGTPLLGLKLETLFYACADTFTSLFSPFSRKFSAISYLLASTTDIDVH